MVPETSAEYSVELRKWSKMNWGSKNEKRLDKKMIAEENQREPTYM